jgi:hypothetical protein
MPPVREHPPPIPLFDRKRPSLRHDLPPGKAPRAAAVKDAAANAAASAEPARSVLCVGHVRQFGGESPLCNLMEVKH